MRDSPIAARIELRVEQSVMDMLAIGDPEANQRADAAERCFYELARDLTSMGIQLPACIPIATLELLASVIPIPPTNRYMRLSRLFAAIVYSDGDPFFH